MFQAQLIANFNSTRLRWLSHTSAHFDTPTPGNSLVSSLVSLQTPAKAETSDRELATPGKLRAGGGTCVMCWQHHIVVQLDVTWRTMKFSTGSSSSSLASDSLSRKSTLCIYTEVDAPPPPCERVSYLSVYLILFLIIIKYKFLPSSWLEIKNPWGYVLQYLI